MGFARWRRRRDSNPRYALTAYNGLANRRLQPLGHVSGLGESSTYDGRSGEQSLELPPGLPPQTQYHERRVLRNVAAMTSAAAPGARRHPASRFAIHASDADRDHVRPPTITAPTIEPKARGASDRAVGCGVRHTPIHYTGVASGIRPAQPAAQFYGLSPAEERMIPQLSRALHYRFQPFLINRRLRWLDPQPEPQWVELCAETNARRSGKDTCRTVLRNRMSPRSTKGTLTDMRRFPYPIGATWPAHAPTSG